LTGRLDIPAANSQENYDLVTVPAVHAATKDAGPTGLFHGERIGEPNGDPPLAELSDCG
jgi:hypothetical protein